MRTLKQILILTVFLTVAIIAQEKEKKQTVTDKDKETILSREPGTEKSKSEVEKASKEKFIDADGDGINDLKNGKRSKKRKGKTDNFVDKDGDGINDNRCQGLGWSGRGKGKGYGKHQR